MTWIRAILRCSSRIMFRGLISLWAIPILLRSTTGWISYLQKQKDKKAYDSSFYVVWHTCIAPIISISSAKTKQKTPYNFVWMCCFHIHVSLLPIYIWPRRPSPLTRSALRTKTQIGDNYYHDSSRNNGLVGVADLVEVDCRLDQLPAKTIRLKSTTTCVLMGCFYVPFSLLPADIWSRRPCTSTRSGSHTTMSICATLRQSSRVKFHGLISLWATPILFKATVVQISYLQNKNKESLQQVVCWCVDFTSPSLSCWPAADPDGSRPLQDQSRPQWLYESAKHYACSSSMMFRRLLQHNVSRIRTITVGDSDLVEVDYRLDQLSTNTKTPKSTTVRLPSFDIQVQVLPPIISISSAKTTNKKDKKSCTTILLLMCCFHVH